MDYTSQNHLFKIKKFIRYVRLYGVDRTIIKVKGQYHMKKVYNQLPSPKKVDSIGIANVGIIGCGTFSYGVIAYYLNKYRKGIVKGVMDVDLNKAASLFESFKCQYYTNDASKIINDEYIQTVFIASNHASHAEYAIDCIKAGKSVHIEKPHVINQDQLERLSTAIIENPKSKVFLGYNRPKAPLFKLLKKYLNDESGALMINWFIAGHEIPDDHWYFKESEGGRVLGNLCHWSDLTLHLVGFHNIFPCKITPSTPIGSKSDFVVSTVFADKSCATFTFSAKGHTFEGVREVLNVHKGNILANLNDFSELTVDNVDKKIKHKLFYRNHGHKENVINSIINDSGEDLSYIQTTARFILAIKQALDSGESVELN